LQQIAPHLFLLDDVQWADTAVWQILAELRPHLQSMSLLILISGRIDTLRRQTAVWETLQKWDREGETIIRLPEMATADLEQLVLRQRPQLTGPQISQLQRSSGGNPLIALNLLDNIPDTVSDIPLSLAHVSRQQLTALSDPAQLALQAAAVIGCRFSYTLWQTILEQVSAADLPQLAGELEQANLINLDEQTYRFAHDTLRAAVYHTTPADRRRHLHRSALEAARQTTPDDTLTLLYHAEGAGLTSLTAEYALQSGQQALAAFSYETAVAHFRKALDNLPADDQINRFTALYGRIQALDVLADRAAQQEDLSHLQQLADQLMQPDKQAKAHYLSARYFYITGQLETALQRSQTGLTLAQSAQNKHLQADFYHQLGQIVREQGAYGRARDYIQKARQSYHQTGSRFGEAVTTDILGGLAWAVDNHAEAIACHAAAARMFHEIGNPFNEAMALNNLGSAWWNQGEYGRARETLEKSLKISRKLGHKRGEGDTLDNLGGISWALADYETAVSFYTQALTIRRQIDDQWGVSISLGNLGSAHRLMQRWDEALRYFAEALAVNRRMGRKRGEGYNRHGRGLTHLDMSNLAAARGDLTAAANLRAELGEQENRLETLGGLALVCLEAGELKDAAAHLRQIASQLADDQRASLRQWLHYVAFRVHQALGQTEPARQQLARSKAAMNEILAPLPPGDQARFRRNFPLNRQILAAWRQYQRQIQVKLARADAPLGRKLTGADFVAVSWTIYRPEDDDISDKAARRRHILKRLLAEAQAQNAAPTDDNLAQALGVSRRTILRDMAALRREGVVLLVTRRRKIRD
ncbi:MAG TPA: tetratricopeptide repeat protein, partial [Anaerolineae bacterium]|nr:tetratricopeptide repeat protein [Anaerolineae bacterium]